MPHAPSSILARVAHSSVRHAYWIVAGWVAIVVALNVAVPQLETVMADDSTPIAPADSEASLALAAMDDEFGNGASTSFGFVVAQRDAGLTEADRQYLRDLSVDLRGDTDNVSFVQDIVAEPELLDALTSDDGKAAYVQFGIPGATGAPTATQQIEHVREHVDTGRPDGLEVAVTGPAATIGDMAVSVERSILLITAFTVVLIAAILMIIYRSIAVVALSLAVIGISLAAARAVVALCGLNIFDVSTFTASLVTAVVLGASTDYVVFLIARYHEFRRSGLRSRAAAVQSGTRVAGVIIGSALTVVIANLCMGLADVGLFTTAGPPIAVAAAVTLLVSLTLTPALIAVVGKRGLLEPREDSRSTRRWERTAAMISRRPGRVLLAGSAPLVALALLYPFMQVQYDESVNQPTTSGSNRGYALLSEHFPLNEVIPDYVVISADHDLRNARDLAALEQAADSIARVEGVELVRGITRPEGEPITEASVPYQSGQIGDELAAAGDDIAEGSDGARQLDAGAGELQQGALAVANGADQAVDGATQLLDGLQDLADGVTSVSTGTDTASGGAGQLTAGAAELAAALDSARAQTQVAVDGLGLASTALGQSLLCGLDPFCAAARDGVKQVYEGQRDLLLPGLSMAADGARRLADGSASLHDGLLQVSTGLDQASQGTQTLVAGQTTLRDRLGDLATGADQVFDGTEQVKGGTEQAAASLEELEDGLAAAADYLQQVGSVANDPAIGGFYLPPSALEDDRLATATGIFLSQDGRTARLFVLGDTESFGREAMDRTLDVREATTLGLKDSNLEGTDVALTGIAPVLSDVKSASDADFTLVALAALIAVFTILLILLRSVVAAGFLLATVVLSYAASMGLAVLVWQIILDRPLDWSVPMIAFVLLVAVGADYNLLLMKRMHEESPNGSAAGIARAVTATGGVISTAGVIFAASLFAMMAGGVQLLTQLGFTIGMGLLIDTFIVRTLVVPAAATLLAHRVWWPQRSASEPA